MSYISITMYMCNVALEHKEHKIKFCLSIYERVSDILNGRNVLR